MKRPIGLKILFALSVPLIGVLSLAAWQNATGIVGLAQQPGVPKAIFAIALMSPVILICVLSMDILLWFRKRTAIIPTLIAASSPTWPYFIAKFATPGLFGESIRLVGDGMTWIWIPSCLGVATYIFVLARKDYLN